MKKVLDEDLKVGILVDLAPEAVRDHIQLNTEKYDSYVLVRKCICDYLETKTANAEADDPMDVSAIGKGKGKEHWWGNGKDKGKEGMGKEHWRGNGKDKGKEGKEGRKGARR